MVCEERVSLGRVSQARFHTNDHIQRLTGDISDGPLSNKE
jgi:hypothetical protein